MTRTRIFNSDKFDVVSYGNGLCYAIHDNVNKVSVFIQGEDDVAAFRVELDAYPADLPFDDFYAEQIAIRA